ncbi:MAG TPA: hypothetical protein VIL88_00415 [Devosia sp.]|jgi:hypothetical protein|uniref:hypothetical protein n=1 Tax=Devosia sp. TaxID=1871048 RepID=UPI002F941DAE
MSQPFEQKGPAQTVEVDRQETANQQDPGRSEQAKKDDKELPGAEGPNSAGANEDTYD